MALKPFCAKVLRSAELAQDLPKRRAIAETEKDLRKIRDAAGKTLVGRSVEYDP